MAEVFLFLYGKGDAREFLLGDLRAGRVSAMERLVGSV